MMRVVPVSQAFDHFVSASCASILLNNSPTPMPETIEVIRNSFQANNVSSIGGVATVLQIVCCGLFVAEKRFKYAAFVRHESIYLLCRVIVD